ncbi:unnamed protein product [Lactuca virosa]|uniref:F-box domain-containing protein n=1 Tax=Lactuca virosa TaxID=75947 RepID=A0AAU9N575_9ASTR|nr:unnamed protein product [Lactuca virosa]
MSDYIPSKILVEIFKRLPVKSVLQLRSLSKRWKSLIDSSKFIAGYGAHQTQPQSLLVTYNDPESQHQDETYASLVDDETFVQQEIRPMLPELTKQLLMSRVIGSSHGLFCLFGYEPNSEMAVLWNPSIRKSVCVAVHGVLLMRQNAILGFGVCRITSNPTIVKIDGSVIEVFTLSTGSWRTLPNNLQINSIKFSWRHVVIDSLTNQEDQDE